MYLAYSLRKSIIVLALGVMSLAFVLIWIRYLQRRAVEGVQMQLQSEKGLLLYIQQQHQSSEEVAYQYIADFVKKHVSAAEQAAIDSLLEQDRQSLLELAQNLLRYFPGELDEI